MLLRVAYDPDREPKVMRVQTGIVNSDDLFLPKRDRIFVLNRDKIYVPVQEHQSGACD